MRGCPRLRLLPLLALALLARPADAQAADSAKRPPGATITGTVFDSVALAPLRGAIVQIIDTRNPTGFARTAIADSLGRFNLRNIPSGNYALGFLHPMLDSLGVEPPLREIRVDGDQQQSVELAIPSPSRLRAAICGRGAAGDSGAVIVGIVRSAENGTALPGVTVTGEWLEVSVGRGGLFRSNPRVGMTTGQNGWFALCGVPRAGNVAIIATRGGDSTDLTDVEIPAERFVRRELHLGSARAAAGLVDSRSGAAAQARRRIRLGNGTATGSVIAAADGRPLAGAQVGLVNGPRTNTNERGEWTLVDAPTGTRMLEVRAIGFYPLLRRVDIVAGAAPVRIELQTLKAVLAMVKIRASRLADRNVSEFQERRRTGIGRFLTPDDIAMRAPVITSDLFRTIPGIRFDSRQGLILMRGTTEDWCNASIYLNGHYMREFTVEDIDDWVMNTRNITGIEVYSESSVPPQFQPGLTGCGSIAIWTR